jgi:hypothetical protein
MACAQHSIIIGAQSSNAPEFVAQNMLETGWPYELCEKVAQNVAEPIIFHN